MKRLLPLLAALLLIAACREQQLEPVSEWEAADIQARAFNFQVYPGARFLPEYTSLLRKAHLATQPGATAVPPMAVYDSDAPLDEVASFYAAKYEVEIEEAAPEGEPAAAFRTRGDLAADARAIEPLLRQLDVATDVSAAEGTYRGVHVSGRGNMPRVTLQRPYFDLVGGTTVDRTLIVLVDERQR